MLSSFWQINRLTDMWHMTSSNLEIVKSCLDNWGFEQSRYRIMPLHYCAMEWIAAQKMSLPVSPKTCRSTFSMETSNNLDTLTDISWLCLDFSWSGNSVPNQFSDYKPLCRSSYHVVRLMIPDQSGWRLTLWKFHFKGYPLLQKDNFSKNVIWGTS